MIHPSTKLRFVDDEVGFGVFATALIPQGTIVWVLDDMDQILPPERVSALDPLRKAAVIEYAYRDAAGNFVLCWDLERYVNHSFTPSTVGTAYNADIAVRDIHLGDEITVDYGTLNLTGPFQPRPEPGSARTVVSPDDLPRLAGDYDALVVTALRHFERVSQPLAGLVHPEHQRKLLEAARSGRLADSLLATYHRRTEGP